MAGRSGDNVPPLLYSELASWFHLLTAPEDYAGEASFYLGLLTGASRIPVEHILELGSGGGNNASHMKSRVALTLTDLSPEMLALSRTINPECEHVQGDMRDLRLGRQFDAVFVHDAVSYLTTGGDLAAAMATAFVHCRPGGSVLFCPDYVRESFREGTERGGHSRGTRGLRFLMWTRDPEPADTEYVVYFTCMLLDGENVSFRSDVHRLGLFPADTWRRLMQEAGFRDVRTVPYPPSVDTPSDTPVFVGAKPACPGEER